MGGGIRDTDRGLQAIRKEMKQLGHLGVKAGIVEGSGNQDGVSVAEYAAYNEYGVKAKPGSDKEWKIPPRSFIGGFVENKDSEIKTTQELLVKLVASGKMDAETAVRRLGQFAQDGIKSYIMTGTFEPNREETKRRKKGSSKPLIDTGTMRNSIRYEVVKK
jgi:phage gpG-like protein